MRTIIILILYVIITILSIPCYLIEWIIRLINPMAAAKIAQVIVKGVFNLVNACIRLPQGDCGAGTDSKRYTGYVRRQPPQFFMILRSGLCYRTEPDRFYFQKRDQKRCLVSRSGCFSSTASLWDRDDIEQSLQVILNAIALVKEGYSYLYRTGRHPQRHRHFAGV